MGWVTALRQSVVGLDTAPIIYLVEEHPTYLEVVDPFFEAVDRGDIQVVTSTMTLIEVLVQPLRRNASSLADQYRDILLHSSNITCVDLTTQIAEQAAVLRSEHTIRTPDAVQMATAVLGGASHFLTNDARLPSLSGMQVLLLDQLR